MKQIAFDTNVSVVARMVYITIILLDKEGKQPSLREIGANVGLTIQAVIANMKELEAYGWLKVDRVGRKNYYTVSHEI